MGRLLVNWLTSLVDKLSQILGGVTSLGLSDKSLQMEILRQVLVANSICFATWVCWESETKKSTETNITVRAVSSRYIRRSQRFDEDLDIVEEDCHLPPPGNWQSLNEQRAPRTKVSLRAQSFSDGWRLLVGASSTIFSDNGSSGTFGIDLALNEIAEEAIQRPNPQSLEMITTVEKALGGALLIINSTHHLLGATTQAFETVGKLTTLPLKRGELLAEPLLSLVRKVTEESVPKPCSQDLEIGERHLTVWVVPMASKGHRLVFLQPSLQQTQPQRAFSDILSKREQEVLECLAKGKSNDEIATALSISPNTVKNHLDRVFKKLGVNNRFAAALARVQMS